MDNPIFLSITAYGMAIAISFLVAALMGRFGPAIKPQIDKYFNWLCVLFMLLLIGGFAVIKLIR